MKKYDILYRNVILYGFFRRYALKIVTLKNEKCFASNCYLLIFDDSFSVVDPSVTYEDAKREVPEIESLKPEYVLLTHGHLDHIWGIDSYVKVGCEVLVSYDDGKMLSDKYLNCAVFLRGDIYSYNGDYRIVCDGEKIKAGNTIFEVIATPGHTKGSLCFLTDGILFSGDTLFAGGSFGRYDLPTGNFEDLRNSLYKLLSLPDDLCIYSGHGEITTMKTNKSFF